MSPAAPAPDAASASEAPQRIGLHSLAPAPGSRRPRKRVGRGEGSGTGKTAGRGQKGAGARSGTKQRANFEGGQMPIHMRMRKLRGPHMKKSMPFEPFRTHTQPVNLAALESRFDAGSEVTLELLAAHGLATRKGVPVKVLAKGELSKALTVHAHAFSAAARERIEAAGGSCVVLDPALFAFGRKRAGARGRVDAAGDTCVVLDPRLSGPDEKVSPEDDGPHLESEEVAPMSLSQAVKHIIHGIRPEFSDAQLDAATKATLEDVQREDLDETEAGKKAAARAIAAAVERAGGSSRSSA